MKNGFRDRMRCTLRMEYTTKNIRRSMAVKHLISCVEKDALQYACDRVFTSFHILYHYYFAQSQLLAIQNGITLAIWFNNYQHGLNVLAPTAFASRTLFWRKSLLRTLLDKFMADVQDSESGTEIMSDLIRVRFTWRRGSEEHLENAVRHLTVMNQISGRATYDTNQKIFICLSACPISSLFKIPLNFFYRKCKFIISGVSMYLFHS